MKPAISQVCTLESSFETDIAEYASGACRTIELWLGKLETFLGSHTVEDARRLLDEHGVTAPVASFQGGLFASQADARQEHWSHFDRRLEVCQALRVETLVLTADLFGPLSQQDLDRAQHSLSDAASRASAYQVRLALEFQGHASFANNLQTAAALVTDAAASNLGLCLDVFHYYGGPSKLEDLAYLSKENLFHVQLCDVAGVPRELAADADRILPGDGDYQLQPILEMLRSIGYDGYVSLELMNPQIWRIPPAQLAEVGMTALRKLLGQASMD